MYNLHPLFVHFPIALFTLYALAEILRFRKLQEQPYWFYTKAILVIIGALSTIPTVIFGLVAKGMMQNPSELVNLHQNYALATAVIGIILAKAYLIAWFNRSSMWLGLSGIPRFVLKAPVAVLFALIILTLVLITSSLGGTIVYGSNSDPISHFVYNLFF